MKQKEMNEKQKEIMKRLADVFQEAKEAGINFIFDSYDNTLSAFNNEAKGVILRWEEYGESFNWTDCETLRGGFWYCDTNCDCVHIDFR